MPPAPLFMHPERRNTKSRWTHINTDSRGKMCWSEAEDWSPIAIGLKLCSSHEHLKLPYTKSLHQGQYCLIRLPAVPQGPMRSFTLPTTSPYDWDTRLPTQWTSIFSLPLPPPPRKNFSSLSLSLTRARLHPSSRLSISSSTITLQSFYSIQLTTTLLFPVWGWGNAYSTENRTQGTALLHQWSNILYLQRHSLVSVVYNN